METRSNHILVGSVVLILLAVLALFLVWLARLNGTAEKEYDIFFKQAVDGLAKGSVVAYSGVPSGQVKEIQLWKPDPQFVRVRVTIDPETPIVQGTAATIQGSFTGTSTIQLDGGLKGAPPITCPETNSEAECPLGVPVIPTKQGGLGAILSSAPKLLERLSTLTERLTELLGDKNQKSIQGILANTDRLTSALAARGPEMAESVVQLKQTLEEVSVAANKLGTLAETTDGVMREDVKPAMQNLNSAVESAKHSMQTLDSAINDARPGLQTFSRRTIPEANQLVRDLRATAQSLSSVAEKIDRNGAGSIIGSPKLPDYKPKK